MRLAHGRDRRAVRAPCRSGTAPLTRMVDEYEQLYHGNETAAGRMIGYYVHHLGHGHLHRAPAVAHGAGGAGDRLLLAVRAEGLGRARGSA